jgi:hypothetical protein
MKKTFGIGQKPWLRAKGQPGGISSLYNVCDNHSFAIIPSAAAKGLKVNKDKPMMTKERNFAKRTHLSAKIFACQPSIPDQTTGLANLRKIYANDLQ